MKRGSICTFGGRCVALLALLGLAPWAVAQSNDCGDCDVLENEPCPEFNYDDAINGGCNSDPDVFFEVTGLAVPGDSVTICGTAATFDFNPSCEGNFDCDGCIWDCDVTSPSAGDGTVGTPDFLELLAQWGMEGSSCDFGLGNAGVGVSEFLDLLANWALVCTDVCEAGQCTETVADRRDTDWYRIDAATLAALDSDGNGLVQITSSIEAEASMATFFVALGDPLCDPDQVAGLSAIGNSFGAACDTDAQCATGNCFGDPNPGDGSMDGVCGGNCLPDDTASEVIVLSDHPNGIVVFAGTAFPTGGLITDGVECSTGQNDYNLTITASSSFEGGNFTSCGPLDLGTDLGACVAASGGGLICSVVTEAQCDGFGGEFTLGEACPCNVRHALSGNPDAAGCSFDPSCCKEVCTLLPQCCLNNWDQSCATTAIEEVGCAPQIGAPVCLATGDDPTVDAFLEVCTDPFGHTADATQFGGEGDVYNPVGPIEEAAVTFGNVTFVFQGPDIAREPLVNNLQAESVYGPDPTLDRDITSSPPSSTSDTNGDGVDDQAVSSYDVFGATLDISVEFTQSVESITTLGGNPAAAYTHTLVITNNDTAAVDFELLRHLDLDMVFDPGGDFANDVVGTNTNGNPGLDRFLFQGEEALPEATVTLSSSDGTLYYGAKNGIDPDGAGPGPAMGFGSDTQQWESFGVPLGWENFIAGIGANVDGVSGQTPAGCTAPCDGSIGLLIPIVGLGGGETVTVCIQHTYGNVFPAGCP